MGLKNYFKAGKKDVATEPASASPPTPDMEMKEGGSGSSSAKSSMPASIYSGASSPKKHYVEEIRHEVMCNYLYQQQCGKGWTDQREDLEQGILIRKSRGAYVAAPPDLAYSRLAANCSAMNVQVRH